jgi:hypothetical protein
MFSNSIPGGRQSDLAASAEHVARVVPGNKAQQNHALEKKAPVV